MGKPFAPPEEQDISNAIYLNSINYNGVAGKSSRAPGSTSSFGNYVDYSYGGYGNGSYQSEGDFK